MGIDVHVFSFLMQFRGTLRGDALCLGRQGFHIRPGTPQWARAQRELVAQVPGAELQAVAGSTGFAEDFLRFLGISTVVSLDYSAFEGANIVHDLNRPVPDELNEAFDFVLDGGTLEHVFNVPMAIANIKRILRPGGLFIGVNPANNQLGHGLYQFSPDLYWRSYSTEAGFAIEALDLVPLSGDAPSRLRDAPGKRQEIGVTPGPTYLMVAARRLVGAPIQTGDVYQTDYAAQWTRHATASGPPASKPVPTPPPPGPLRRPRPAVRQGAASSPEVILMQTAAGERYKDILNATQILNRLYCKKQGFKYHQYIGIKRGYYDWHSTYNRLAMLDELIEEDFKGWALFVDADAFVRDQDFDLRSYISCLAPGIAFVAETGSGAGKWDVNAGVFLIDLGSPTGRKIVCEWKRVTARLAPDHALDLVVEPWGFLPNGRRIPNDQSSLHLIFKENEDFQTALLIEDGLLNYPKGKFIAQVLRKENEGHATRISNLKKYCAETLAKAGELVADLDGLATKFGSDKGTKVGNAHGYTAFYSFLFEQFRYRAFSALEIGLLRGGPEAGGALDRVGNVTPSINMWLEYFPFARFFGIDISDFSKLQSERFLFHKLDLSDLNGAIALRQKMPQMKFVVEDASHASYHQQVAFAAFFPLVEPGGYYIIEDLNWQPAHMEAELPKVMLTRDAFHRYNIFGDLPLATDIQAIVDAEGHLGQIADVFVHRRTTNEAHHGMMKLIAIRKSG